MAEKKKKRKQRVPKNETPIEKFDRLMVENNLVWAVRATGDESKKLCPLIDALKAGFSVRLYIFNADEVPLDIIAVEHVLSDEEQ